MADDDLTISEDKLDETIEESFPASDPPANTVVTGVGGAAAPTDAGKSTDPPPLTSAPRRPESR
jgi:hypothetical protein